jgi:RimJ/RimL family protein N-acetyltransferase
MSTENLNDVYRASNLKREAAELIRHSLPMRLLELKAAATAMTPDTEYTRNIPSPYVSAGMGNLLKGFGWFGGGALLAAAGYLGYKFNKNKMQANLADKIENAGSLKELMQKESRMSIERFDPKVFVKHASTGRDEVREIMRKIYDEDPSYWPYGLDIAGHDSVYLVRDNMTKQAAGFVGWQVVKQAGRKIGSYSIGILPEYRNNGLAKEAVAKIIQEKAASVDEVRSYVCKHNLRSRNLAKSLDIQVQSEF